MSIQRTHKQSDLEKRLKLLNQQLYGKKEKQSSAISSQSSDKDSVKLQMTTKSDDWRLKTESYSNSDVTYLRQDLTRIVILAALAFAVELGLYFGKGVI